MVRRQLEGVGAAEAGDVLLVPGTGPHGFDPRVVLEALRDAGYRRVLIEGGGITVSRSVQAGVVDRLHVTVAPLLIGSGRTALTLPVTSARAWRPIAIPCAFVIEPTAPAEGQR